MRADDIKALDTTTLDGLEITLDLHTRERVPVDHYTAFSWSVSRHHMFEACKRRYYLNYYGSRRVIDAKDRLISAVWWLKQVTSIRTWIGSVIHKAAQEAVRAVVEGEKLPDEKVAERANDLFRAGLTASQRGTKVEGQWLALLGHVYPERGFALDLDAAAALVDDLAHTFLDSEAYALIRENPDHVREVDEPFQSFLLDSGSRIGRTRVFAIPDVLLHDGEQITVIDWKTGDVTEPGIHKQAGVYRLYAHRAYGLPEEAIRVQISDLGNYGETVDPPGGTPPLAEAGEFIRGSIGQMVELMEDVTYNTVSIRSFPLTADRSQCLRCGFQRACWRHEDGDE
ncbi:MAG: PD-(D/E)XK nuclease family protein [Anaerolineae bacterium]|nr:PD-(D/E)XK nuclease family protein [Anaerolineae bacterium]